MSNYKDKQLYMVVVVTDSDNRMLTALPDKKEVHDTLQDSNLRAAPGTDGSEQISYQQSSEPV